MNDIFLNPDDAILMGVVNVTPDSFSDGGCHFQPEKAIEQALKLRDEGATILDIGGESTRPNAQPVSVEAEQNRVIPVIAALKDCGVMVSVDTRNAATMRAAIKAGAGMVNDVSALTHDAESLSVVAQSGVYVCLMHMRGNPQTMQNNPVYCAVMADVYGYLKERMDVCLAAGVDQNRIILDPGIGFGKTLDDNVKLMKNINKFNDLGAKVMLGASRKSFIDKICPNTPVDARLGGSLASVLAAYSKGVKMFRVHDVRETKQALDVFRHVN